MTQCDANCSLASNSLIVRENTEQSHPLLVLQEIYFFLRGLPYESTVSTREPAESPNYFQMLLCLLQYFGMAWGLRDQHTVEPHRLHLILQILAMFERKV